MLLLILQIYIVSIMCFCVPACMQKNCTSPKSGTFVIKGYFKSCQESMDLFRILET